MNISKAIRISVLIATSSSVYAEGVDPFATSENDDLVAGNMSNLTASLDFIYQGTYIPELRHIQSNELFENNAIVDSQIKWTISDDAKIKTRGMVSYNYKQLGGNSSDESDIKALEYYYEHRLSKAGHYVSVGRKNLGWSAGFQWRPADLIDNGFTTKNFDSMDPARYSGIDQIQYEMTGSVVDYSLLLSTHDESFYRGKQIASKISFKRFIDGSLFYAKVGDYSEKFGLALDGNLPWATTFVLEAVQVEIDKSNLTDPFYFGRTLESLSGIGSYQDIFLGLTRYIDDKQRFSVEYFHNGRGFRHGMQEQMIDQSVSHYMKSGGGSLFIDSKIFEEQYLGRNYLYAAYTGFHSGYEAQVKPSVLVNMDDGSYIGSLSVKKEFGGNSELLIKANYYHGGKESDFGSISPGISFGVSYLLHIF
ncbi:hypothetical protein [Rheinheimera baltica]|uniref:hypothetical protein n=1 Tax=Rheinheimera baltica TaxID=67576 RepID=UPI0004289F5B|nr:hypothetical protein [Rheinheimera baltica]